MLSAKGFVAATRSYPRLRLLLPLILLGLLLPLAAPAQITEPGTAAAGNAGSDANAGVAVPNAIQGTNGNFGKVNVGASSATPVAIVFTFDADCDAGFYGSGYAGRQEPGLYRCRRRHLHGKQDLQCKRHLHGEGDLQAQGARRALWRRRAL